MTWQELCISLLTATLGSVGFSIIFYAKPKRLPLSALGGLLTWAVYLGVKTLVGGELIPNLGAALVGAIFSEITARLTKAPVPVYLMPCIIPLVPGGMLYETMSRFVSGAYGEAGKCGLEALKVAAGIAGGIIASSVLVMVYRYLKSKFGKTTP